MNNDLHSLKPSLIIFDLDGTLYVDQTAIEGAVDAVQLLREAGYQLRFMTNTTTKTQDDLYQQLRSMGFNVLEGELISAPEASRIYLRQKQQQQNNPITLWPVVAESIKPDFAAFIIDAQAPDFIVLGDIGEAWTLDLLNQIFNAMQSGARLIALHKNKFWHKQGGLHVDIGLFVAGLEYVTGQHAQVMGKPSLGFFQQVLKSADCLPNQALLIGDDIDSDIGGAQSVGIKAALVKTGKYREAYLQASPIKPDIVLSSVAQLPDYLDTLCS